MCNQLRSTVSRLTGPGLPIRRLLTEQLCISSWRIDLENGEPKSFLNQITMSVRHFFAGRTSPVRGRAVFITPAFRQNSSSQKRRDGRDEYCPLPRFSCSNTVQYDEA